jgi:acyl dehydratase
MSSTAVSRRVFDRPGDLASAIGEDLGTSAWRTVTRGMVGEFANATDDHQWIHVDADRAATGPFGRTIAHGFLTLSLLPTLIRELYQVHNVSMGINYGLDSVRFLTPVPVGGRIRASARIADVTGDDKRTRVTLAATVELEGSERPACVASFIVMWIAS